MQNTNEIFRKYTDEDTFSKIKDYDSISSMWEHCLAEYGDNVAVVDGGAVTYAQLEGQIAVLRGELLAKGVKKNDYVGLFAPNSLFFIKSYLAITTLGACAVLLPEHLDETALFGCVKKFGISALVYDASKKDKVLFTLERDKSIVAIDGLDGEYLPARHVAVEKTAPCSVIFTGGTTGKSKGALLSQQAIMRGTKNGCYGIKEVFEQKIFLILPLTHVFGLIRTMLTSLYTGSTLFVCRNKQNMFKDIAEFKPTTFVLVPALAEMALSLSKKFGRNMLGQDAKTIICGAATVAPYLAKEYSDMGVTLLPGYGLTESANLVSGNPIPLTDATSVGFVYPGIEYKIVDDELWIKGINVFDGYVNDEAETAAAFEDGYFKTGDLARVSDDGLLYITGRKKEIIVLASGENVYPAEIENKIYEIDTVRDCLVYEYEQMLCVEILPRDEVVKRLGIVDIQKHFEEKIEELNKTLPSYERINRVVVRQEDFVRSPAMKVLREKNGKK